MEPFLLDHAPQIPLLLPFLTWTDLEHLSSVSRKLSYSLLRDVFFLRSRVVVPSGVSNRGREQIIRAILSQLSLFTHHLAIANCSLLTLLARLPRLSRLRIGLPFVNDDLMPIRLTHDEILSLGRLASIVSLELDAFVDDLGSLFRGMTHLQTLDLVFRISNADLRVLAPLQSLQDLRARGEIVNGIDTIGRLTQLVSLELRSWHVHDITAIAHLTRLEYLSLRRCNVIDLAPLASLRNLKRLVLDETPVVELSPIAHLVGLQWLSLARSQVSDLTPLSACHASLQCLDLSGCTLTHVQALIELTKLECLRLHYTTWPRLGTEPTITVILIGLPNLQELDGRVLPLPEIPRPLDFSALRSIRSLEHLDLSGAAVVELVHPLALPQLTWLRIEWNYTRELDIPLAAVVHPHLRVLHLVRLRLQSLRNLVWLPALQELRLIDVFLEDYSRIALATQLTQYEHSCAMVHSHVVVDGEVRHAKAPTQDLSALGTLVHLTHVDLSFTSIQSIAPLETLRQLRFLDLSWTNVVDVTVLGTLPNLECLRLRDTEIVCFDGGACGRVLRELVLPAHVDCRAIRLNAPLLKRLLHPDRDCLWGGHGGADTEERTVDGRCTPS